LSRLHALVARPRRTLAALAVVLAAVGITVGSGANFTASSANAGNAFATGTLTMSNSASALFSSANMKPGDSATGNVSITNTGSIAGDFKLTTASPTGSTALLNQLDAVVTDCGVYTSTLPSCTTGTTQLYSGKLGALSNVSAGTFAAGVKHYYKVVVTLPSSTDNTFQGLSSQVDLAWSATQS
jgi:spore coat-associated protein N